MGEIIIHIIPAIGCGFVLQLILHELGHLISGLFTGWKFLYLQIYRLVFKRVNNKLKLIIVGDIGYKCIMYPKSINNNAMLYTMGGCISNLIFATLGLIAVIIISMSPVMWLYTWSFTAFGIGLLFMNGKASTKRVCNDKACYNLLKMNKHNVMCHNAQLIIAKHLMEGLTYKEIGEELICLSPDIAKNDIQAYQAVLEYYYFLDSNNYLKMGQAINKIRSYGNISREVLEIVEQELMYIRLLCAIILKSKALHENNSDKLGWNMYKGQRGAMDIHTERIKAVYDAYVLFNKGYKDKAIEALNKALKRLEKGSSVYEGERKFCVKQLMEVKSIIESTIIKIVPEKTYAVL